MSFKLKVEGLERLKEKLVQVKAPVNRQTALDIGLTVTQEMRSLIRRGISPIKNAGKFPPYKAASAVSKARQTLKGSARKEAIAGAKKKGYPYSVQSKFPAKKISPVNLELSGDFIGDLESRAVRDGNQYAAEVGYYDALSKKKEQGHREGANGQPKRPTIPQGGDEFTERITSKISQILRNRIRSLLR